ncbi:MAG: Ig-like domain-containing protein [Bacteroidales bacterium]|nr:Ig-like domain-containing protein [Bacteroidales bacterium]
MKNLLKSLLTLSAALVAASACVQEPETLPADETHPILFTAESIATRTAFGAPDGDRYPTLWTENDRNVKIILNAAEAKDAAVTAAPDGKSAVFTASFDDAASYTFQAVSPASAFLGVADNQVTLSVPASQTPAAQSVDETAQILIAASGTTATRPEKVSFQFNHWTSYGKMTLADVALDGAVISGIDLTAEEAWTGLWTYSFADGTSVPAEPSTTLSLQTDGTGDVWFACAPVDLSGKKLSVSIKTDKGRLKKEITLPAGSKFESGKIARFTVSFKDIPLQDVKTSEIAIKGKRILIATGRQFDLSGWYTVSPADAIDTRVGFTSSDEDIATVTEDGIVTGVNEGDAVITLAAKDGGASAQVTVRVANLPDFGELTQSEPVSLDNCDAITNHTRKSQPDGTDCTIATEGQKEGSGWFKRTVKNGAAEWSRIVLSGKVVDARLTSYHRAHLAFWFYVDEEGRYTTGGVERNLADHLRARFANNTFTQKCRIELSHAGGGNGANQNISWSFKDFVLPQLQPGWNRIDLPFKDATVNSSTDGWQLNPEGLNFFRILMDGSAVNYDDQPVIGLDDIVIYEDYEPTSAPKVYLHDFESAAGFAGVQAIFFNPAEKSAASRWESGINVIQLPLGDKTYDTGATRDNGHLHFKLYISDISKLSPLDGQVEISSSGTSDKQELHWGTNSFIKYCRSGWNDVTLELNRTGQHDVCDLSAINWFRIYNTASGSVWVQVKDVYLYAE